MLYSCIRMTTVGVKGLTCMQDFPQGVKYWWVFLPTFTVDEPDEIESYLDD